MEYYARQPLEIFALDANMNRLNSRIIYTSLIWRRRYYEPGEFQVTVFADDYDPRWAYVYCYDRPETGMVQKVQYDDTAHTPDGRDTVTVSGFFLEEMLSWTTFLVEQTETETVVIERPRNRNNIPTTHTELEVWEDPTTGLLAYKDPVDGEYKSADGQVVDMGSDFVQVDYVYNGKESIREDGSKGWWNDSAGYYTSEDGKLHSVFYGSYDVDDEATDDAYDVALKVNGTYFYYNDGYKRYFAVSGVADKRENTFIGRLKAWERGPKTKEVQIKGPWQRTEIGEPETVKDSVQLVYDWVRKFWTNEMQFVETDVTGIEKAIDPSLKTLREFAYSTLQEVEASLRITYDFEMDTWAFWVYKGDDLTQATNAPEETSQVAALASSSDYPVPEGYTELEYIQSVGAQYIDTGFQPNQDTRAVCDFELMATPYSQVVMFGERPTWGQDQFLLTYTGSTFRSDYGTQNTSFPASIQAVGRHTIDKNRNVSTLDGTVVSASGETFSSGMNIYICALNNNETASIFSTMKVYSFKLYDNGTLVRDLVPCKVDASGAVGMWDKVGQTFYANAGSGSFVAGPDVPRPVDPEPPEPSKVGRWQTFNDTWGSMYDYSASTDDSAYRNTCFVLYQYDKPRGFDDEGYPAIEPVFGEVEDGSSSTGTGVGRIGFSVPYDTVQGYYEVYVGEDGETRKEVYLDQRDVKPSADQDWPRDTIKWTVPGRPTPEQLGLTKCKDIYDAYPDTLKDAGKEYLATEWGVVDTLDTGTLDTDGYITKYDLGDRVDWSVNALGITKEARITAVEEVYESGRIDINLTIGEEQVTVSRRVRRQSGGRAG